MKEMKNYDEILNYFKLISLIFIAMIRSNFKHKVIILSICLKYFEDTEETKNESPIVEYL